jgi:hypothetical protein
MYPKTLGLEQVSEPQTFQQLMEMTNEQAVDLEEAAFRQIDAIDFSQNNLGLLTE